MKQDADEDWFALESHDRLVCAALPINEQDCRLPEGMAETIWDAMARFPGFLLYRSFTGVVVPSA